VDMRRIWKLLVPGVEHTEKADLSSEMCGIASDFEKSFCASTKQQNHRSLSYFAGPAQASCGGSVNTDMT